MTKAEAIAINALLPDARRDIQEVQLRLTMHNAGKLDLSEDAIDDSAERLARSVDAIDTVTKMAIASMD